MCCYACNEATAAWLVAGLYKHYTLLYLSLNQLHALRTQRVVADVQLQGQFDFVHRITAL